MQCFRVLYHEISYKSFVFSRYQVASGIFHTTRERCITIIYHAIEKYSGQHNQCDIRVMHDGKVGCNTIENTTGLAVSYLPPFYTLSAFIDQI